MGCKKCEYEGRTCLSCSLRKRAEYQLTGTDDPEEQRKYWEEVWKVVRQLKRERFKRALKNGYYS